MKTDISVREADALHAQRPSRGVKAVLVALAQRVFLASTRVVIVVSRVLGSSDVWRECVHNKGVSSANQGTFRTVKDALCAPTRCLDVISALAQKHARSAQTVSWKSILLRVVVNATKQHRKI